MRLTLGQKFAEKHIDGFFDRVYHNVQRNPADEYIFDCTVVGWISNEELLAFTALLKYFVLHKIRFRVEFIRADVNVREVPKRVALQLIQIWEVWKIWRVLNEPDYRTYFGIDNSEIEALKLQHNYRPKYSKIYSRYGITPFVSLEKIVDYKDWAIDRTLGEVYRLDHATSEIVRLYKCEHPFVNETLSHIISKELYENFLDHFKPGFFPKGQDFAFMSLSLRSTQPGDLTDASVQATLRGNFNSEAIPETLPFFYDRVKGVFRNQSVVELSFLDFGEGIPNSLRAVYAQEHPGNNLFSFRDSDILKYAFRYDSSRFRSNDAEQHADRLIPRGLFDVLSMVKRYDGLLIARSNRGKILFDFSDGKGIDDAFSYFGDEGQFFPGTMISIYIPETKSTKEFDASVIKPVIHPGKYVTSQIAYINIYHVINGIRVAKKDIYDTLVGEIARQMPKGPSAYTIFFSFSGYQSDRRLARKAIYFLLTDYEINLKYNVIVVHPPSLDIIDAIGRELLDLTVAARKYTVHPLPFVFYESEPETIKLRWLGVYDEGDIVKLDQLLFEQFSLARTDFSDPAKVVGHINYFDEFGNLQTHFPARDRILAYYRSGYSGAEESEVIKLLETYECVQQGKNGELCLCPGNYYQEAFVEIIHLLNHDMSCHFLTEILFRRLQEKMQRDCAYQFLGVTPSSHKILSSLVEQGFVMEDDVIFLDNHFSDDPNANFWKIRKGGNYILVCDVASTGFFTNQLRRKIERNGGALALVGVIVNTIDKEFEQSNKFLEDFRDKFVVLHNHPIKKYRKDHKTVQTYLLTRDPVRVNPFTNVIVNLSVADTNPKSILLTTDEFLDNIDDNDIYLGYLHFNFLIHPYFFDTRRIIENMGTSLLTKIFDGISPDKLNVFYPKKSGIKYIDFVRLNNKVFKNHSVAYYELERFKTPEGWKFPHATDYFLKLNDDRRVLILDDGSCTGDSLLQMIDEMAFSQVKEIIVLCFIGRITDHKREFFSRVSHIQARPGSQVKISIRFVSHWHIPTYYPEENPNIKERTWLEEVIALQNTPEPIRTIARVILDAITPLSLDDFRPYRFLPVERATGIRPKKDILKAREEIGKIIGFRFYKENFDFFNKINKDGYKKGPERYKRIELLCAAFGYEPYLYDKLSFALPDITTVIEDFIDDLIFKKGIVMEKDLYYKWNKKDIVHLFFVVYRGRRLAEKLKDTQAVTQLISYPEGIESSINYVLFKSLAYFPLSRKDLPGKNVGAFLHLTDLLLQNASIKSGFFPALKIFRSFVGTLPSHKDYYSRLSVINEHYRKIKDSHQHKESVLADYDKIMVDLEVMLVEYKAVRKTDFLESWKNVSNFIELLLSFASSFPAFFLNRLPSLEGDGSLSLRSVHGQLNAMINTLNPTADFNRIKELVSGFRDKFLHPESDMSRIFSEISTTDALQRIRFLFETAPSVNKNIRFFYKTEGSITLDFPYFFLSEVIFKEIINNLRHSDLEKPVTIMFEQQGAVLSIGISNPISAQQVHGSGYGLATLKKLNEFPNGIITYEPPDKLNKNPFIQLLKIKTI